MRSKKTNKIMTEVCECEIKRLQFVLLVGVFIFVSLLSSSGFLAYSTVKGVMQTPTALALEATQEAQVAYLAQSSRNLWFEMDKDYLPFLGATVLSMFLFWKKVNLFDQFKRFQQATSYYLHIK